MSHRLGHLDGLRGIAALLVLYQHLVEHWVAVAPGGFMQAQLTWLFTYLDLGKLGVVVFFALSGFVVPVSFRGASPRQAFLLSRLFRLFPAYWLTVLVAALVLPAMSGEPVTSRQTLANLTMVPGLWHEEDILGIFWTLRIEWVFYGLCLVLFSAGWLKSSFATQCLALALLVFAVGAGVMRGGGHGFVPVGLPINLAVMLFGHQMRLAHIERNDFALRHWRWLMLALTVMIPLAWALAYDDSSHKESVLADCTAFLLGVWVFVACVLWRWFGQAVLRGLGRISYGIYLIHPVALALFLVGPVGSLDNLTLRALLTLLTTLVVAYVMLQVIEQPAIRLGRRLGDRLAGMPRVQDRSA